MGLTGNKATQVSVKKKETVSAGAQTDDVVILSKEEFQEFKDSGSIKELEASPLPRKPSLQQAIQIGFTDQPLYDITEKGIKYANDQKTVVAQEKDETQYEDPRQIFVSQEEV